MSASAKAPHRALPQRELRIAIAALFRAGFTVSRIAQLLRLAHPAEVEIELREYLLEARP